MIPFQKAKSIVKKNLYSLGQETVPLNESVGRTLSENITAHFPSPRFDNSAMDGFAVRSEDTKNASKDNPIPLKIVGVSSAGSPFNRSIGPGECIQCMTGAKIPEGSDSVVMVENTSGFKDDNNDTREFLFSPPRFKKDSEFAEQFALAKSEAKKYFNNDEVYIEKFFQNPRHIEVQIMSGKNRTVHLHERDCSVQRRHQKLIEETPSPILNEKIRKDLFAKTVNMVSKIGYEGAGTVEYIYEDEKFYFLEMNTRVQVEHPVTEVVTGIDIIKEQIHVAFTGETALKQEDIKPRGHAIECRINAEDASKNFQPSPGTIGMCHQPSGFRTRVDSSIYQGYKVTPYYDSMICKLICHGRNRTEAIQRMKRSLDEFIIEGITTTVDLHKKLLNHNKFINSNFNVSWLDKEKII